MRVICPHCQKSVTLPETAAEQPTPCPACGNIFTAPALMAVPAVPEPPTPAKVVEPMITVAPPVPPTPTPAAAPSAAATTVVPGGVQFRLTKRIVQWIGPIGLVLFFVLSLFRWVGSYPSDYPVYTQTAWQVMTSGFTTDATGDEVFGREADLRSQSSWGWLMCFSLLFVTPMVLVALLDIFEEYITVPIPDVVQYVWPHRRTVLLGVAAFVFVLLNLQMFTGFGLESAASRVADVRTTPVVATDAPKSEAAPKTDVGTKPKLIRELKRGAELSQFCLERTTAFWLAYLALLVSTIGYAFELWLARRGTRPEPRLELHW